MDESPQSSPEILPKDSALTGLLDELARGGSAFSGSKPAKMPKKASKTITIQPQVKEVRSLEIKAEENIGNEALRGVASKLVPVLDEAIDNYRADRDQIQEVIAHIQSMVFSNPKVKPAMVEHLITGYKIKGEMNANFAKLLDSGAKIVSAGKGELFVKQTSSSTAALNQLLENCRDDDLDT